MSSYILYFWLEICLLKALIANFVTCFLNLVLECLFTWKTKWIVFSTDDIPMKTVPTDKSVDESPGGAIPVTDTPNVEPVFSRTFFAINSATSPE